MRPLVLLLFLGALATACTSARPTERLDRQGRRRGLHRTYYDDARSQLHTRGRYRRGQPVGRWRYYAEAGGLERTERYRRHGFSDIAYYYPSGRVARHGRGRTVAEPDGTHFYWLGAWPCYSPTGALDSVQVYQLGKLTTTNYLTSKRKRASN